MRNVRALVKLGSEWALKLGCIPHIKEKRDGRCCLWTATGSSYKTWKSRATAKRAERKRVSLSHIGELSNCSTTWNKVRVSLPPFVPLSPWSTSTVIRYRCVCWELSLFQNQVRRLKCLIICEVGLKLFPLLGDSIKWLSAGELHQIPRVNKSSSPLHQLFEKRLTADERLLSHYKKFNMKTWTYDYI